MMLGEWAGDLARKVLPHTLLSQTYMNAGRSVKHDPIPTDSETKLLDYNLASPQIKLITLIKQFE